MNSKSNRRSIQFLNLYFQIHQPLRLRKFQFFDIGSGIPYFDEELNKVIMERVANRCYLPMNKMLLDLLDRFPGLRVTFSISGIALEQMERYVPEVIDSFRKLTSTEAVEILGETYYHSLSSLNNPLEFEHQVRKHREKVFELFGTLPRIFRNTELIYSDVIGQLVYDLGFNGIYLDGVERVVGANGARNVYQHPNRDLILFPRDYRLSDDLAFRFSDRQWKHWPLSPDRYVAWLSSASGPGNFLCLGMDYETFGEHQKYESGIFGFFERFIGMISRRPDFQFINPSAAIIRPGATGRLTIPNVVSWADQRKDLSAWLGNDLQKDAFRTLRQLGADIVVLNDEKLLEDYRMLQASDHLYYMSTKDSEDGDVHRYFSPYPSPYEAFINYMNVLADMEYRISRLRRNVDTSVRLGFVPSLTTANR